jgi:hypothetical protein
LTSTRVAVLVAIAFLGAIIAAVVLALPSTCNGQPQGIACPKPTPDIASPVDGVVIEVDAASLTDIRGFTLRASNGGFAFAFTLGTLENATEFSPSHLKEHQATSAPIRVWFRLENGVRVAYRLEDAPG